MKKSIFTAVLLFSCTLDFSQTQLSGKVTDENGDELIGCTVKLMQNNNIVSGRVADFEGIYTFQTLEPGIYDLEITYTGYKTKRLEKVVLNVNNVHKMDVVLEVAIPDCCDLVHWYFYPPLIDMNPGNTGTILTATRIYRKE